MNELVTTCSCH